MAKLFGGIFKKLEMPQIIHPPSANTKDNQPASAFTYMTQQADTTICSAEANEAMDTLETEEMVCSKAFQRLSELANDVYGMHDPFEVAQKVLRVACEFYDADWCGMFDADMMLDLWMPFWWYNRITGGMTETQLKGGQVMGSFEMFRKMIVDNTSYHLEDVERIRISRPEEYALFTSQDVKSFLSVPYSRREHGIIFLRNPKRYGDKPDMLRIVANILIQEINQQKHLDRMKINAASADMRKDADVIVNLFGSIEIITAQGKLVEAEMKSQTCSKIFALLMLNRHRGMPAKELSDLIWADKDYDNPTGNLRSNLYRLRNMFELLSDEELIVTTANGYRINPDLKIASDYEQFETLFKSVTPFMNTQTQVGILKEAVKLYDGKLFPNGSGEHWLIPYSAKYHMMYLEAVDKLMMLLNDGEDYKTLHDYAMKAIKIDPDSPVVIYWLVVALRKNGAIEMAKKHLESAKARLLEEEYRDLEERLRTAA